MNEEWLLLYRSGERCEKEELEIDHAEVGPETTGPRRVLQHVVSVSRHHRLPRQ